MKAKQKGFNNQTQTKPRKQLTKGLDPTTKQFPELLTRTLNTPKASIYIWRKVVPLLSTPSRLIDPYVYEVRRLPITTSTLTTLQRLDDGIYLNLMGYIWDTATQTPLNIERLLGGEFLGLGLDLDVFTQYVAKRLQTQGKFNISKRVFYIVGKKRTR